MHNVGREVITLVATYLTHIFIPPLIALETIFQLIFFALCSMELQEGITVVITARCDFVALTEVLCITGKLGLAIGILADENG